MKHLVRFLMLSLAAILLVSLLGPASGGLASPLNQDDAATQKARAMLARMAPEERVGQLFLVTFQGSTFDETSQIYNLITSYHVSGVVLQRSNDNFPASDNLPAQMLTLNNLLQETEWNASQKTINSTTGAKTAIKPQYIPLLIGIAQEGDGSPNDQILSGLTTLPDLMSVGATWNPSLAEQTGEVMGNELSSLGFNLYLGPSLDVLETPQAGSTEDLGVRTFGGSAYWVGKLGQAYISGLHQGSNNSLVVIAKHFPGRGGSDRSPDEEIATVRKSLDQLKRVDLAPFFAVTGNATDPLMVTDGLVVPHIRYQGIQGTIRSTTRPISSDGAALDQLLKLPALTQWRAKGGVLVSDNLGSPALRRFYDPTGNSFDARAVAREAFVAGNDLLFTDHLVSTGDPDSFTTLTHTLDYFAQKYREDAVFAQRVDASVVRILALKYRLYPDFTLTQVSTSDTRLANIGRSQPVVFDVARRGVTLISPSAADLPNILPRGPEPRDRIVFLTDVQTSRQCTTCSDLAGLAVDTLQSTVLRLYGPRAGGQISQNLMSSYSFLDLWKYMTGLSTGNANTPNAQPLQLETDLKTATWVVVAMLKPNAAQPETFAFRRLLTDRPDLLRNKKVVAFAFNAPYYLDATDISKLTAYYGLYSKGGPFVEVASRILFQDLSAAGMGALPVSVTGVGYDLAIAVSPDANQVIPLFIDNPSTATPSATGTAEPTPAPVFRVGDVIPLRTGVITDINHNAVPDGTPVRFGYSVISESSGSTQTYIDTETVDGVARAMYRIERPGLLEIHVSTNQNARSNLIRLDITSGVSAGVTLIAPTAEPTETLVPTPTLTITPTVTPTPVVPPPPTVKFQDWFLAIFVALASAIVMAWVGIRQAITRWGLRWALCGVIGGMISYSYLALNLPGTEALLRQAGTPGVGLVTFLGIVVGWGIGVLWRQLGAPARQPTGPKSQSS